MAISGSGATVQGQQVGDGANAKGWNAFARVTNEISGYEKISLSLQGTARGAKTVDLRIGNDAALDNVSFPASTARTTGAWSRDAWLPSGGDAWLRRSRYGAGTIDA